MINGLAVLGWGVGGIEAEAAMLGQPIPMLIPEVIGFQLTGALPEGATATDLVLTVTQMLRKKGVVGKFVEFYGPGLAEPDPGRPGDHRQHGPGIRRHLRLLPGHPGDHRLPGGHRPRRPTAWRWSRPTPRPRACGASRPIRSRCSPTPWNWTCRRVLPSLAGPKRPQDRVLLTDAARRVQDGPDRRDFGKADTAGRALQGRGRELRHRPRRRGDRRHHLLHQHLEPLGADRRRPRGQEGRREGPEGEAVGEDLAGPRLRRWSPTI